ncbi:MAG: hypothetical protein COT91_02790 [Candidatus Doudnabacteria bacterium CG10_big_fil_rev_8_21_14_0_10_41_10]|uniref:DUF192 domain-containing protein n=1 Tax=Candidatus Doudnabacteria bacterium CG10_big_fil_rev_8_21_14_0_10_41_10 TaxID=1974551 RepID=A0A2H0VDI6_9BACT|nr:MAG: hypothetical protein COT91_02790 [Candidatus Doudnabacteria bacterium CG10_big_fil_rev_8_21_14_0_10_41_10]
MDTIVKSKIKMSKFKSEMQKVKMLIVLPLVLLAFSCGSQVNFESVSGSVVIGEKEIFVEIADNDQERSQGLMNRKKLPKDMGMLFVFEGYGQRSFWMKDTLIPLDIIWISDDRIVHIEKNVPTSEELFPPRYSPNKLANYVLEVNAGIAEEYGWATGDLVKIQISNDK